MSLHPAIYLASQSPRRQELLRQLDVDFDLLLPADTAEAHAMEALEARLGREAPRRYVARVTRLKAEAALARLQARGLPARPVLCADTTVARGLEIYGKPGSPAEAAAMLKALAGSTHRVLTAVVVAHGKRMFEAVSESTVEFAPMTRAQIAAYVATGEPFGKAGAYAVQGRVAAYIRTIHGSYSGIMGLPLYETAQLLAKFAGRTATKSVRRAG